jgi:photosystem II stability/assembly factor-like uncharacterized protein
MKKIGLLFAFLLTISYQVNAQWVESNGPYADNITAFHFSRGLSFAGSYLNGIYRSTDNGIHWTSTSYNYGSTVTCFLELNDTLFAGTDQQDVYRSVDSGFNWTRLTNGNFFNERVSSLVLHNQKIYVATYGHGIFRLEGSNSFIPVNGTLPNLNITSLLSADTILFAGTSGAGIFHSTDNGNNWLQSSNGLGNLSVTCLLHYNEYMFAGTNSGIFRSSDNGQNWISINNGLPVSSITAVSVHNGELFTASNWYGIYHSSDNGESWQEAGLTDKSIASLASTGTSLFAGFAYGYGGMFASTDNGNTWLQKNTGIHKATVRTITSLNSVIYAGTDWAGIFRSTNGGMIWDQIKPSMTVYSIIVKGSKIYAGTNFGLLCSTDGGEQWNEIGPSGSFGGIYSICTIDSFLFIGTGTVDCHVFRSTNDGYSWNSILNPYPSSTVNTMCLNDSTIFIGALESSYRSTDYGTTWIQLSGVYSPLSFYAANGVVYVGCNGPGVYRSIDNGISWTRLELGFTNLTVESMCALGDNVFAGTFSWGVFKSSDIGNNWVIDGLLQRVIYSQYVCDTLLYAGLAQGGIWYRSLSEITDVALETHSATPLSFLLQQNYPNPFNPSTSIQYAINSTQFVTLKVYDLLGREVATLVNEEKPAGSYEIDFNVGRDSSPALASGIYFYKLQAGDFVETKKMILLK